MAQSLFSTTERGNGQISAELHHPPALFYALVHNDVPVATDLRIENHTGTDLGPVEVSVQLTGPGGPLSEIWSRRARTLPSSGALWWDDFRDLVPDAAALRAADEAFPVTYRVTVRAEGAAELAYSAPSRALAHNEWLNSPSVYESIAAFVQPNADSVGHILRVAAGLLERDTGSGSMQGYQADPKRVTHTGAAIYEALRSEAITYVSLPASFEETGQKVRTTASVLRDRLGNCIDLAVTYAACLEAAGLHPLIWFVEGHAFAGFFLHDDRLPESVALEANQLVNIVESGAALPVELTGIGTGSGVLGFTQAVETAIRHLRGNSELLGMVDVHLAHKSGIRAMPSSDTAMPDVANEPSTRRTPRSITELPAELVRAGVFDEDENLEVRAADDGAPPRIRAWRRALLDLSLRNPLLKLPRTGKGLDLHVPGGALAELDDLIHDNKAIRIIAQDLVSGVHRLKGIHRAQDLDPSALADELRTDKRIYGAVTEASYVSKMRALQRDARTQEQETGSNYLYLTLGALVHSTPSGEGRAPLFLVPVRIEGGTGRKPYSVVVDGDETAAPNWCLIQWLRVKHNVRIPELEHPITDESGVDINRSLAAIRKTLVENNLDHRIDESASLRLLQFSTFQMWRDLTQHWQTILANPVVEHLVNRPGEPFMDPAGTDDPRVDETELQLPIPADGSQMRAIAMAEQGRSFVLEGPPGTGKSQTITNLIAHAIRTGKTVLFVAEKQAALDVVKRRLGKVGLEHFCLDLHGRKQSVRSIRQQLKDAHEQHARADDHGWRVLDARYRAEITTLRGYPDQLHNPNAAGYSFWSAYQTTLVHDAGVTAPVPASFFSLPEDVRATATDAAAQLPTTAKSAQLRPEHPWSLSTRRDMRGLDTEAVTQAAEQLESARAAFAQLPTALRTAIEGLPNPTELGAALACAHLAGSGRLPGEAEVSSARRPGWDATAVALGTAIDEFRAAHQPALDAFRAETFVHPDFEDWSAAAVASRKGLFGKKKRRAALAERIRPCALPGTTVDESTVLEHIAGLVSARQAAGMLNAQIKTLPPFGLGAGWLPTQPDARQEWNAAVQAVISSRELSASHPEVWRALLTSGPVTPADELRQFCLVWTQWTELLAITAESRQRWGEQGWAPAWQRDGAAWLADLRSFGLLPVQRWGALLDQAELLGRAGLTEFRQQLLRGELPNEELELCFLRGVAAAALAERARSQGLEYFDGAAHDRHVEQYLRLGADLRNHLPAQLGAAVVNRRPRDSGGRRDEAGELIRRLNSRKDRLSFREAVKTYPRAVAALTPCFLMSPASVANFLEPGALTFDLVVFDEASQIRVAQAVGAMGRARSVVVVGDSKQMPPTSIMEASHDGDAEEDSSVVEDLDSILTESVESGLPQEWLSWHYRSTQESLIAFSNDRYYDGKLATLPAPGSDPTLGISWRRVDGAFDRGTRASRTNRVEAEAIVDEIAALLRDSRTGTRSIGVVTFNVQQRDLLLNLLEESTDERIHAALARQDGEALFVKNLENVQGDERDVVFFSLAFSKDPESGILPLNFGPLSLTGGERRLNVAITRARKQVVLYSSFDPADIDLSRTRAVGTKHLRAYLEMAAHGPERTTSSASQREHQIDRVLDEVASVLESRGFETRKHHGLSHFTVDLAVRRPGSRQWQVAVMLDGPQWSSRPTVADREAAPQLLATVMGWPSVIRLWLPAWLNDRDGVLARIDAACPEVAEEPEVADASEGLSAPAAYEVPESPPVPEETPQPVAVTRLVHDDVPLPAWPVRDGDGPAVSQFEPYRPTIIGSREDFDQVATDRRIRELLQRSFLEIIAAEGPIEEERLVRKVVQQFGFDRVRAARRAEAMRSRPKGLIKRSSRFGTFYWPGHLDPDTWTEYRRTQNSAERAFDEIAPEEIVNAMRQALEAGEGATGEGLERATMERLGYGRKTANIERILGWAVGYGVASGNLPARLTELTAGVLDDEPAAPAPAPEVGETGTVADEITSWLTPLDDAALAILSNRYFAEEPLTLEEVGTQFGLSSTRARQIEAGAKHALMARLARSTRVNALLAKLRADIQPVAALSRLIDRHPEIAAKVEPVDAPLWLVLDKFDDFFEVVDGWAVAPSAEAAAEQTAMLLADLADEYGMVELSRLGSVVNRFGMDSDELEAWLEWCDYGEVRTRILTRTSSFADQAAAVLSLVSTPLTIDELGTELGMYRPPVGAAQQLGADSRFTLAERGGWALATWRSEADNDLVAAIGAILDVTGNIPLDELIGRIQARARGTSEAAISAAAAQHPFETRSGRVWRGTRSPAARKTPEETGRLFRKDGAWLLRVRVTQDHLRGASVPIPVALATAIGLARDDQVEFHSPVGLGAVRWSGLQPTSPSVRLLLERTGTPIGAVVFLRFGDDGIFDVEVPGPVPDDPPLARALWFAGRWEAPTQNAERELAAAVRLSGTADRRTLLATYRGRGDDEIVTALEEAWAK